MVTPRNEATAGVRGADEQWRMLAEALPLIVWSARPDGFIEYQNNRWYEFSGLRPGTLGDEWRDLVHPDDLSRVASRWDNSIRTGEPFELEYRMRRRDGAWRWLLSRGLPARDEAGGIVRWLGSCTDITDIVGAREAMAREADRLEQMVAQRTRDLQDTQARLAHAQRMEALGQLAGGIAHDFNNVLQSVQGGAELIEQHADDLERTRRLSRVVQGAATRGMAITRRLLALSRYSDLRSEPVEAGPLLAGMAEIFASTLGRGIEVRVEAAAALPLLFADKGQLETVLINLATNARDAMQGTGTLTLAAAAETLAREGGPRHPVGLKPGDYVRLSVTDTGVGMGADILPRALEPFFTTKPIGKGTGLGLSIAQGFAEQSGGGLQIDSIPGYGTTVTLWLPVAAGAAPQEAVAERLHADDEALAGHACVLVVDDEAHVREIVAEQLETLGYPVVPAGSGAEALALLDDGEEVGLLLSDLAMPGMDGITLIREVQRRRPGLPAILLTGFATQGAELALSGTQGGNFSVLVKPIGAQLLADQVAVLLKGARMAEQRAASRGFAFLYCNETGVAPPTPALPRKGGGSSAE